VNPPKNSHFTEQVRRPSLICQGPTAHFLVKRSTRTPPARFLGDSRPFSSEPPAHFLGSNRPFPRDSTFQPLDYRAKTRPRNWKLREIEIFRCGQLSLWITIKHRLLGASPPPARSLRSPQSAMRSSHPGIPHRGMRLRRIPCALLSGAHPPAHRPDHPPQPSEQAETPHCSPMRAPGEGGATGEGSSPMGGPLRLIGRSPDAPIGISQG
jgi:hypothetical protein